MQHDTLHSGPWRWQFLASFWRETKDPEGVQQDSPGRKPWVQGQIAESPERAAQRGSVSTPDKCSS